MAFSALPRNERRKALCTDVTGAADDIKNKLIKEKKSMKLKSKKSALLMSFTSLLICFAMLVGSTFAWFTDTATTGVNKIVAGNLDVELLMYKEANGESDYVNISKETAPIFGSETSKVAQNNNLDTLWEPGKTQVAYLAIKNEGNLDLKYQVALNVTNPADGKDLYKAMQYAIAPDVMGGSAPPAWTTGSSVIPGAQIVSGMDTTGAAPAGVKLLHGSTHYFALLVHMDEDADNRYQNGKVEFDLTVYAAQLNSENDSFGPNYDKDAEYAVEVKTADELYKALEKDDDVILTADIALPDNWTPAGNGTRSGASFTGDSYAGTFNGNGKTISNVKNSLFGVVTGTVKNVKLEAAINNTESDSVGAVAGILAGGTVSDVTVNGSVQGEEAVGGIVGRVLAEGTVSNCTNNATVESTSGSDAAGGIVGKAYYTVAGKEMNITGCKNTGTVKGKYAAGGIVGFSAANVKNCENNGTIEMSGSGASAVGGIIGEQTNYGTISGNKNTKNITVNGSTNVNVGGIIGWIRYQNNAAAYANNMTIVVSDNENSGSISSGTGTGAGLGTGGIVGLAYNQAKVNGNKNTAANISGGTFAAGIVGGLQVNADNLTIGESVRFIVTGNTSATTLDNISGNCKDLFAYNNEPGNNAFADISGNTAE